MASSSRLELEKLLKDIQVDTDVVFDVGGAQLPVRSRLGSFKAKEYKIIDLAKPHEGSITPDYVMDLNVDFTVDYPELLEKADYVFCLEVADYWYDPVHAMDQLAKMLKDNGTLVVSFQFMYPTHNPIEQDYLRYTEFAIRKLADVTGLTIEAIYRREAETNAIDELWRKERLRAAKNYNHDVTGWLAVMSK